MAQETTTELLPAEGRMEVSVATAFRQWLALVLQDYEDQAGGGELNKFATYLAGRAAAGSEESLAGLSLVAEFCWGRGAPMGYGNGPNVRLEQEGEQVVLSWLGTWTENRDIVWRFSVGDAVAQVEWVSGTGKPSRFISATLAPTS